MVDVVSCEEVFVGGVCSLDLYMYFAGEPLRTLHP